LIFLSFEFVSDLGFRYSDLLSARLLQRFAVCQGQNRPKSEAEVDNPEGLFIFGQKVRIFPNF
jgi:hypothetical protein